MKVDLHQHSKCSDGTDSIVELINNNIATGVEIMAITDHDTITGCRQCASAKISDKIKIVYGIEFSTEYNGEKVHILAYNFDLDSPVINNLITQSMDLRLKRVARRIELLKSEFNIEFTDENLEIIKSSKNPNKVLLAKLLIKQGFEGTISDVINQYLYHDVSDEKLATLSVIKQLNEENILSIYAHPLGGVGEKRVDFDTVKSRVKAFKEVGLSGIECYYSLYTQEEINNLINIANIESLLVSAGSDYHGKNKTVGIGEIGKQLNNIDFNKITIIKELIK